MSEAEEGQVEAQRDTQEHVDGRQDRGVTFRAILLGLCIAVAVCLLDNTVRYVQHGSSLARNHMPMANLIPFLLSILACAFLARWFSMWFVLSSTEWITVFCMGFVSALNPTYGVSGYIVSLMAAPYYFATPENQWSEYLHPYLPMWLIPRNEDRVITYFYEGLPPGASIPWGSWLVLLFWWFSFACAVGFACACVSILIHRQWSAHERLVYPMMTPIADMAMGAGAGERWLPGFMGGKAFWAGFGLTTLIFWWNMISWFYPQVPTFPTERGWLFYSQSYPPILISVSMAVICFSYFASLDVLFSLWFFDLLFTLEGGTLNRVGITATSPHYGTGPYTFQTAGGFVVLVLWGLWVARLHLRDALGKALRPASSRIDDGGELLSYRGAFIGLIVCCAYMAFWLSRAGMEGKMIVFLIPATFFVYLGLAKILADTGLISAEPPTSGWEISLLAFGGEGALKASSHMAHALSGFVIGHHDMRGFALPVMAHINRLGDFVREGKRRLFWAVCAAFVVGMVVSTLYTIWLGYTMGAFNFQPNWLIINTGRRMYEPLVVDVLKDPRPIEALNYVFFLIGAGVMAFLNLMRYRFIWWPFHPIGFALSGTVYVRLTAFTILLAWLLKFVMIKLVGPSFYRRSRPFFIGLLVGYVLAVAAGVVVDTIWFPTTGHEVHRWY